MTTISAILVLYNCNLEETDTLNSLLKNYTKNPNAFSNFKLIIYDNSLVEQKLHLAIPFEYEYFHDPSNRGLAVAYNYALKNALKESCDWLLLLDQDSSLPDNFIENLMQDLSKVDVVGEVAAVVPKMCFKNVIFSPTRILYGGIVRAIGRRHRGICTFKNACAIGSGSVVRVSFFKKTGGFNEVFWMDCLDRWMFYMINKVGAKIYVTDSIVEHELSVRNYDKFMNEKRYLNIIKAETLFMKSYGSRIENYIYYSRLIKRAIWQFFSVSDKKYSVMTLRHLVGVMLSVDRLQNS